MTQPSGALETIQPTAKISRRTPISACCVSLILGALAGCGGGGMDGSIGTGGAPVNAANEIELVSGDGFSIEGLISSDDNLLVSMSWQAQSKSLSAPRLNLSNADCKIITKQDRVYAGAAAPRTGNSRWGCDVGVMAPVVLTEEVYKLIVSGTDDRGNTKTQERLVRVKPAPEGQQPTNAREAGGDLRVQAGKTVDLVCNPQSGVGPYSINWALIEASGYPITLSSYTGERTSLVAPATTQNVNLTVSCRSVDSEGRVRTSLVQLTVNAIAENTLTAKASPAVVQTQPGRVETLTATSGWIDPLGQTATGPVVSYRWSLGAGAPAGISLTNATSSTAQVAVASSFASGAYNVPIELRATAGELVATSTVLLRIDPNGVQNVVVTPANSQVISGAGVELSASGGSTGTPLFYKWTIVSGPMVQLAGAASSKLSFTAPTVVDPTQMIVRLAVGYEPITASYPGIYTVDSIVEVAPVVPPAAPAVP